MTDLMNRVAWEVQKAFAYFQAKQFWHCALSVVKAFGLSINNLVELGGILVKSAYKPMLGSILTVLNDYSALDYHILVVMILYFGGVKSGEEPVSHLDKYFQGLEACSRAIQLLYLGSSVQQRQSPFSEMQSLPPMLMDILPSL
jgi:hypothetical protein